MKATGLRRFEAGAKMFVALRASLLLLMKCLRVLKTLLVHLSL